MATFVALLASGLAAGAIYALAAMGFLVLYRATGVINFAQGDLITLGAYVAVWASTDLDLPIVVAYAVSVVALFVVGITLERLTYVPLRGRSVTTIVIATLGAAIVIRSLIGLWWGSTPTSLDSPLGYRVIHFAGAAISQQRILIMVVTAVSVVGIGLVFERTQLGRQFRSLAANREVSLLLGVRTKRISMLAWGVSAALSALAGVLIAPLGAVDLNLGFSIMLNGFAAAILGGFGSLGGAVAGGVLLGLVERVVGGYALASYQEAYPFVLMLLVIAWRPRGLFGTTERHL